MDGHDLGYTSADSSIVVNTVWQNAYSLWIPYAKKGDFKSCKPQITLSADCLSAIHL